MVSNTWPAVALAVCCLLATGLVGVGSAQTTATELNSCTTIEEPGRYVLTDDVTSSSGGVCIDIRADDVVLDGNGAVVAGNASADNATDSVGISVGTGDELSDVTVSNVTVRDWSTGVRWTNVSDGTLIDSTVTANTGDGVVINDSTDATLTNNTVTDNGDDGIDVTDVDGLVAADNTLSGNGGLPIEVTNATEIQIESTNGAANGSGDATPTTETESP
jgi:parallel beta-helix repeat protein